MTNPNPKERTPEDVGREILDMDERELRDAVSAMGLDFDELAAQGRAAASRALSDHDRLLACRAAEDFAEEYNTRICGRPAAPTPVLVGVLERAMQQARREGMREAANLDLLEFVNESTRRKEAQADLEAAGRVGVPMACAAVELYRSAIKVRAAERLAELGGDDD